MTSTKKHRRIIPFNEKFTSMCKRDWNTLMVNILKINGGKCCTIWNFLRADKWKIQQLASGDRSQSEYSALKILHNIALGLWGTKCIRKMSAVCRLRSYSQDTSFLNTQNPKNWKSKTLLVPSNSDKWYYPCRKWLHLVISWIYSKGFRVYWY